MRFRQSNYVNFIMDFNLDVRLKQLQNLEHYISSSWDKVHSVLDRIKWNIKEVTEDNQIIKCSVDPAHRIHAVNADEHILKCTLRKQGYKLDENFLSEPLHDVNSSILIDDHKKIDILSTAHKSTPNFKSGWNGQDPDPKTADRLVSTFSSDERLALYTYAVENTVGPTTLPEFNIVQPPKGENKTFTYEELLKQERDAKRRRIKYKSVHTNRKNHTEVLREVIDGQMQLYKDWLENKDEVSLKPSTSNEHDDNFEQKYSDDHVSKRSSSVVSRNSTHSSNQSNGSYLKNRTRGSERHSHHRDYDYKRHYRDYKSHKRDIKHEKYYSSRHSRREDKDNYYSSRKR